MQSCQGPGAYSAYRYAQLILQTRAFKLPSGPVLCPLIDLTNHLSAGSNARTRLEGATEGAGASAAGASAGTAGASVGVTVGVAATAAAGNDGPNVVSASASGGAITARAVASGGAKSSDGTSGNGTSAAASGDSAGSAQIEPCMVLRATRALVMGEEVFKDYDPEADYSDLFERYGFLDETSSLHTAEVSE